ncbi:DUF5683 domain-containing protein [Nibribacter koreensis]|uniref:DUF5683 domain-containing protein n=1 Tax=Nibribacter koreensis TaxID=1084519 RepID=A0ABP8F840_9BACT
MRSSIAVFIFFCAFAFGFLPEAKAQVITATPDSVLVPAAAAIDTTAAKKRFLTDWSKPAKAAFYSAVLPGLGQAYNKSYWKIPLVYATGAVIGYFIYDNNRKYQTFATAYRYRTDGDPATVDAYVDNGNYKIDLANDQGTNNLRRSRDFFRKYRDLDIILAVVAYGLNVMEAHVDAHLKGFDVSDDLSLQFTPGLQRMANTSYAPMFTLQLNLKK